MFVMQAAQHRSGAHPAALADPVAGSWYRGRHRKLPSPQTLDANSVRSLRVLARVRSDRDAELTSTSATVIE